MLEVEASGLHQGPVALRVVIVGTHLDPDTRFWTSVCSNLCRHDSFSLAVRQIIALEQTCIINLTAGADE